MNCQSNVFEKISFWNLIRKYSVEIPIIQRDYAQGRESQGSVRSLFLQALYDALSVKEIELDFIYGNLQENSFQPLDGQQRLTTLFLLHWYAARKDKVDSSYKANLSKFLYETRSSSKAFCRDLVQEEFNLDFSKDEISSCIKDCPWFFSVWESDPTVNGMLRMLDAIHQKFKGVEDLFEKLISDEKAVITFYYTTLEGCGLSDDLYIKMNARGKPLTGFENFKALFEKKVETEEWDSIYDSEDKFSIKIDTKWTDAFWSLISPDSSGIRHIDRPLFNFFKQVSVCSLAKSKESPASKTIGRLLNDKELLEPKHFNQDAYKILRCALDLISENKLPYKASELAMFGLVQSLPNILNELIQGQGPIYLKRVLLYAQISFLSKCESNDSAYLNWMRVVRNITLQTAIDSPDTFIGAIRLITELSQGAQNIYSYLAENEVKSSFAANQIKEEIRKARIIKAKPEHMLLLHKLEDLAFFRGRVSFAFYCVDEDSDSIELDFTLLETVRVVVEKYFSKGITSDLRRALFTINDGRFYKYWRSTLLAVDSPKYCAVMNDDEFRDLAHRNPYFKKYLKELVLRLRKISSLSDLFSSYEPSENIPNWMRRLIQEPSLMKSCHSGFFSVNEAEGICYLIQGSRVANSKKGRSRLTEVR